MNTSQPGLNKPAVDAAVLSPEERSEFRQPLGDSLIQSSPLLQLANIVARIHGKRIDQITSITLKFESASALT